MRVWEGGGAIPREVLLEWVADAEGILSVGHTISVDETLLKAAPKLRALAQVGKGYDNIDVAACTARGIPFGNTPGVLAEATADLVFGIMLSAMRRIHEGWQRVKAGQWQEVMGSDLYGKTLGIAGMGDIGTAVARRARASGMNIIYCNRKPSPHEAQLEARHVRLDELLEQSDCIVVLVPLTSDSKGMFGKEQFDRMKPSAYFVNASRGALVQTSALYEALREHKIAYAALDVTDPEPLPGDHPLLELPNVLVTPHIGSATLETRTRMAMLAVDNLLCGLAGQPMPSCVNRSLYSNRS